MTTRPMLGARVRGCAAAVLVRVLDERLAHVETLAAAGVVTAQDLTDTREAFAEIREAGQAWVEWRAAANGSAEALPAETAPRSMHEICSDEAAEMLGVSSRRVRQLLAAGLLEGRLAGRTWLVSRPSVLLCREMRSAA